VSGYACMTDTPRQNTHAAIAAVARTRGPAK
jgi:hypothetical protein